MRFERYARPSSRTCGRQAKRAPLRLHVAELGERQQEPPSRGPRQSARRRDLAQRQRCVAVERADHGEAALERLDEIAPAVGPRPLVRSRLDRRRPKRASGYIAVPGELAVDFAGGREELRQNRAPNCLDGPAAGLRIDVDRSDDAPLPVMDRSRHGAQPLLELLIDERPALPPHLQQLGSQPLGIDHRSRGQRAENRRLQEPVEPLVALSSEEDAAERGCERRVAGSDRHRHREDAPGGDVRHVDDPIPVEDRRGRRFAHRADEPSQVRQRRIGQRQPGEVRPAELEHARAQLERPSLGPHVAEAGERQAENGAPRPASARSPPRPRSASPASPGRRCG